MSNEASLIERVRTRIASPAGLARAAGLRIGIGDDAAVLRPRDGAEWVLSCDAFLENVHFLRKAHSPAVVGYKALARATSDLAAMGARPRVFLLSLALPSDLTARWLEGFLKGMARAARKFGLVLAGGDTSRNPTVAISITVLGEVAPGRAVTRSGARPGDLLYVTGQLGGAQLGLELVLRGMYHRRRWQALLRPHFYPELRLDFGRWLASRRFASAMIDTSDGLSTDLGHLCSASRVGARLWAGHIPRVQIPPALRRHGFDPLELALHGGEDYQLLFAVPRRFGARIPRSYRGGAITAIGEVTRSKSLVLVGGDGRTTPLVPAGWDHFRSK